MTRCLKATPTHLLFGVAFGVRGRGDRSAACWGLALLVGIVVGVGAPLEGTAQPARGAICQRAVTGLDRAAFQSVYCSRSPVLRGAMRGADATAYPAFFGAIPAAWAGAWLRGEGGYGDAFRLTLTGATTYGVVIGFKRLAGRKRPYAAGIGVQSRSPRMYDPDGPDARRSMPSGHASMAAALATSWSLSHPYWYVIAPGATWAASVALSRVWLGVHYPSDIVVGLALGAAIATGWHLLGPSLTPSALQTHAAAPLPVTLRVRF
jgi:membrane-associated phospholipid phosphatase